MQNCLHAFADMMPHVRINREAMLASAKKGFATATDLADYLVRKGLAFRDAHEIVGKAVRLGLETRRDLSEISLPELQKFSPEIESDVFDVLTLEGSVAARDLFGGTAPKRVREAARLARRKLEGAKKS